MKVSGSLVPEHQYSSGHPMMKVTIYGSVQETGKETLTPRRNLLFLSINKTCYYTET